MWRLYICLFFLPLWAFCLENKPITVKLQHPQYKDGTLTTNQGGIIISKDMRIQAQHIVYISKTEQGRQIHSVIAEGNLLVENRGIFYGGKRLEYNFVTKTGVIYEGVSSIGLWFLGGKKIGLNPDRSIFICNAFVTTSESSTSDWKVQSQELTVSKEGILTTKNVTFRFLDIPIFWLPFFKSNLNTLSDVPVRFDIAWDTGYWPLLSVRYPLYSNETLDLFFRLNVRPSQGLSNGIGGALESDFLSANKQTQFKTKSYIDKNTFWRDDDPNIPKHHYRLQGDYRAYSKNKHSHLFITYDWLSSKTLQTNFPTDNFELSQAKQTTMQIRNIQNSMLFGIDGSFRINSFEGMRQQLPTTFWTPRPFQMGNSGIISQNRFKLSYLDYVSAKGVEPDVPDFSSGRLSTYNELYRPFSYKGFSSTPLIGFRGIFYSDSQKNRAISQAVFNYDLFSKLSLERSFKTVRHIASPYIHFSGLSSPTESPGSPYIFNLNDGFNHLDVLKVGIRNYFYIKNSLLFEPNFVIDLYAYAFFKAHTFEKTIPKLRGALTWNFPSVAIHSNLEWNFENDVLNYINSGLSWTINENFAFKTELRHRSRFYWRNDDPDNFIMQVSRTIPELLHSPLSDGRNILMTRLQLKIAPQWIARIESHIGWGRRKEPGYNAVKVNLSTVISTSWKINISYSHAPGPDGKNDHFNFKIKLERN